MASFKFRSVLMISAFDLGALFRPEDPTLSDAEKSSVQVHRLLTLIGTAGVLLLGFIHRQADPGATDPLWARLSVAALFPGLIVLSYYSERVRHAYVFWVRVLFYVGMTWLIVIVSLNEMATAYTIGLLLAYATLLLVVGLGARSLWPVLRFAAYGLFATAVGGLMAGASEEILVVLFVSMGTAAVVEAVVIGRLFAIRDKLEKRERRLRSITENVSEGIYRSAPGEGLVYANQALAEMFGYDSVAQVLEADPSSFYANPEERERHREEARQQEDFDSIEIRLRRKDGTTFTGLLSGTVIRDESGDVAYYDGTITDITGQKQHELQLEKAKEEAEKASRVKSVFLANMSHEIRTPLTSILGFAEVIGQEIDEDMEGKIPRFARLIEESGKELLETLDAVLNLSRLEAGEMELVPETVPLEEPVREVVEVHRPEAKEAGIALEAHLEAQATARVDEGGLKLILRNLLSNALKYTEEGGSVDVRVREKKGKSVIEVEDTGVGMDPAMVPKLFEPFRQASEGASRQYEGTGLGLAVTRRMARQMDGAIDVETEQGEGSRFTVRVPRGKRTVE